ncbi:MAG: glycine betaine/L-proline ABC transporter substrate-binding protein ProX [Roseofilum sp. SBFL]|uniref:glycine betaine/L-proline ABC transporter substrate-binding protein ProX n=1 Tax=unclassified Roseofilum TaxID=2620099 RepID=UPI001B009B75|nr:MULTISPECIES: glycine betaine/L-proline ABC transporter substrate-binding protein ProX [unclassified Roseofilum]MBP0015015.1 glycine betaine/L-proline ABC transporter substrate-binding protein ProX [Roseofilum sp. SID3]MBP0024545.1 glycine betaine/L-proline ABC transporter substrate-binding protein ProX [Roseofilum sp. SID2]MBP0041402.1 glycine betaine/L-proline ABC transporter substrate-binding protein ProX [Roseofilum sp. SBFL]
MIQLRTKTVAWGTIVGGLLLGAIACQPSNTPTTQSEVSSENTDLPGTGITVQSVHTSLLEERFQTQIVNKALQKLGYETPEPAELETATMVVAISNGDVDYTTNHWENNQTQLYENSGGEDNLSKLGVIVPNLLQGYQIDKKTADKYQITNLEQLQDPEIAKLFDSDGDGKANLIGCNSGWACELTIEHHLDAYGLRDTVENDQGQFGALIAETIVRYNQGEPVLFYMWTPFWVGSLLKPGEDTIWLQVSKTDLPEGQTELTEADTTAEGKNLGFPVDRMRILANKKFVDENPAAKKLFEVVQIPIEDISGQNNLMEQGEDQPEDIERHVNQWIEDNQETFDSWVEEAMAAQS